VRHRLLTLAGAIALALAMLPTVAMAQTPTSSSTTTSTTTTTTLPDESSTTQVECPEGAGKVEGADVNADSENQLVTATFTVADGCEGVKLTLASYRVFGSTNKPLSDSVADVVDAGDGQLTLTLPATCTYEVYLVLGDAPATAPDIDQDEVLAGGTRTSTACSGGGSDDDGPTLPFTGTSTAVPLLVLGLGLVTGGASFLLLTRTRRTRRLAR
jgi:hypothetical protein